MKNNLAWPRCLEIFYLGCHSLLQSFPESSSSSQGISLKGWAVSADNDVASDSRCRTTCLFQASGFLLYFDKNIRAEIWHFQSPAPTQIYCLQKSLLPFKHSSCFSDSLRISFTIYYLLPLMCPILNLWLHCNSGFIPQFISYLSKSCLPLAS